jgi:PGF-pre-PGF domain-containing protein
VINANSTIRTAEITVEQLVKPVNITNVSGIPYCYFNVTTTNLTDTNITNATIEFKVNKTWLNERNIDETTITLNKYSNNHWSVLPTSKIKEDNATLYFASETPGFSLFAISGDEKQTYLASAEPEAETGTEVEVEPETEEPMPEATAAPSPAPGLGTILIPESVLKIPMSLIVISIAIIAIAGMIIAVLKRK